MSNFKVGFVYVVLLGNGIVKVGRSGNQAEQRVKSHGHTARLMGVDVVDSFISPRVADSYHLESRLINHCLRAGVVVSGREWFSGVDFDSLIDIASSAPAVSDELIREQRAKREGVGDLVLDGIDNYFNSNSCDQRKWVEVNGHAARLMKMLNRNIKDPTILTFEFEGSGQNKFLVNAALSLSAMSEDEILDCYQLASKSNGDYLILYFSERARSLSMSTIGKVYDISDLMEPKEFDQLSTKWGVTT